MITTRVVSTVPELVGKLERLKVEIEPAKAAALAVAAPAVEALGVRIFRERTPVGPETSDEHEHLRDTTEGDAAYSTAGALITWRQTKTIPIDGEDVPLAAVLTGGRKGEYYIHPTTKQALFWPGAPGGHPWGSAHVVKPVAPNPYIAEAMTEILPATREVIAPFGEMMTLRVLTVMR